MKSLIISVVILGLLVGVWGGFMIHTYHDMENIKYIIEEKILPQVEQEQWEAAKKNFLYIKEGWEAHHEFYLLFLDGSAISRIQETLVRAEGSLNGKEQTAAATELKLLEEQLDLLYKNELLTIENVF